MAFLHTIDPSIQSESDIDRQMVTHFTSTSQALEINGSKMEQHKVDNTTLTDSYTTL